EEAADVRVVQRRDRARLALEALVERTVNGLDGDDAIEPRVARLPHFAHAAGADRGQDLVRSDPRTDLEWQEETWIIGDTRVRDYSRPLPHDSRRQEHTRPHSPDTVLRAGDADG